MGITKRSDPVKASESQKGTRSPDWSLQLDSMKLESLVIVNQNVAVNTFPDLVHTARHTMGVGCTRSGLNNRKEFAHHGMIHDWGEVVTR